MVIDGDVSELPSGSLASAAGLALAFTISGNAMANGIEAAEFFDIDVDDLTGLLALVARPGLLWLER